MADAACERVKELQAFDFVVEQLDAYRQLRVLGGKDVDGVAPHAEFAAREILVIALVLHAHQLGDGIALADFVARANRHHHSVVALGLTDTVDGRDSSHHDHVAPLQDAFGATQAHLLDVLVDGAVFFNEQIALRHIGFGLVIVVVTDEIFDRVLREKLAKFAVKLGGQGFVGRKDDGGTAHARNHIGHGEGFARSRYPQQGLEDFAIVDAFDQFVDRSGLVPCWRIRLEQLKRRTGVADKCAGARSCSTFSGNFAFRLGFGKC